MNFSAHGNANSNDRLPVVLHNFRCNVGNGIKQIAVVRDIHDVVAQGNSIALDADNRSVILHTKQHFTTEPVQERANRLKHVGFNAAGATLELGSETLSTFQQFQQPRISHIAIPPESPM